MGSSSSLASPAFVVASSFFLLLSHLAFHSSDATHPECGLSTIYCKDEKRMINSTVGKPYEIKSINVDNGTIVIHDVQLSESLRNNNCSGLYNFSTPIFAPLSFKVDTPNITLLKCENYSNLSPVTDPDLGVYSHCNDHSMLFYGHPKQSLLNALSLAHASSPAHAPAPDNCSVIHVPVQPPWDGNWSTSHLLHLLEKGISLERKYTPECRDCETKCRRDMWGAQKKCVVTKHGYEMKLRSILGIAFGALVVGILLTALIVYCCPRCRNSRLLCLAKSKNFSPSTHFFNSSSKVNLQKGGITYFGVHIFSYDELVEATNNFDSSKELGDGGFGIVYCGKLRDGRLVAVKRLYENTFRRVEQFINEVEILTHLRHQNLVTLYGCTSRHSRELLLVYEYIPNGTVADHLHGDSAEPGSFTWPIRMSIAIETARALSYLHASDVIHRDVKTNNILLDNNFHVKVADFGLSRLFPLDVTHVSTAPQGTPGYVDPAYHQCYKLTNKSDVYSFGVVLIELISSKPAVDINRHYHEINLANLAINKIKNGALHELVDPCLGFESDYAVRIMITQVAQLAFRCLQLEREMRPSMNEVLEVLRGIESEEYKVEKGEVVVIPSDDVGLLESIPSPLSLDSVTDKWISWSTTLSASV